MSEERLTIVREQLFQLERRIKPLEWDASRKQINEFKKLELGRLKEEHAKLSKEFVELEAAVPKVEE